MILAVELLYYIAVKNKAVKNCSPAACSFKSLFKCSKHDPNNFLNNDAILFKETIHFLFLNFHVFSSIGNFNSLKDENKIFFTQHVPEVYFYDSAQSSNFQNNEHLVTFLFYKQNFNFGTQNTRKSITEFSFKSLDLY